MEGDYLTISSPDSEAEANPSLQDEEDKEANNVKARILPLRWIPWEVFFKVNIQTLFAWKISAGV